VHAWFRPSCNRLMNYWYDTAEILGPSKEIAAEWLAHAWQTAELLNEDKHNGLMGTPPCGGKTLWESWARGVYPTGSRRPRSPDTYNPTRRTRARPCRHKTDSKQCQDASMGQHSDSTTAQRHDESPCTLSQAREQASDGYSSTWAAAQSPLAKQPPLTAPSL